eukprot:EST47480.1 hypothetical protein SS50377_12465 [Spironucleus salmonicida]
MSKYKKIWDVDVSVDTFKLLQPLVDIIRYNQQVDPQVALQQIFLADPNFTLNQLVLTEVIQLLSRICKISQDSIIFEVQKYVSDTQSHEKCVQVQKWIKMIKPVSNKQTTLSQQQKVRIQIKSPYHGSHPLGVAFSSKLNKFREDSHTAYQVQINEYKHCYTQILEPNIEYINFDVQQLEYTKVILPQIHPSLNLIFAAPMAKLVKHQINTVNTFKWSQSQIDIGFSNDSFDAPDLILARRNVHDEILEDFNDCLLQKTQQWYLRTKKPVAQHHGIIDLTGCYVPKEVIFQSIYQRLLIKLKQNGFVSVFDIVEETKYLIYFPPFQAIVDQRFYGTISRFLRFNSNINQSSCYVKSVGIGGQVRFQIHGSRDLGANEEITLFHSYSVVKETSELGLFLTHFNDVIEQIQLICDSKKWLNYTKNYNQNQQVLGKNAFLISFFDILMSKNTFYKTKILNQSELISFLNENLKFHFPVIPAQQFGIEPGGLGICQNYDSTITIGNEFLPVIFQNLQQSGILQSESSILKFVKEFENDSIFMNSFNYFAIQRAYSYYNYQCEIEPGNSQARQVKLILENQTKTLLDAQLVIFTGPHLYPNFLPFQIYSPLLRNIYDVTLEKILITTFSSLSGTLQGAAIGLEEFSSYEIKKLCLRLIQQNPVFNRLSWGENISLNEFYEASMKLIQKSTYRDIDEALAQFIDVNVIELAKYANFAFRGEVKQISDKIQLLVNAFRGHIDPPIEELLHCRVDPELVRFICSELIEFLKNLAPLNLKPRVESKKIMQEGKNWPFCSLVGSVGIDSGWGYQNTTLPQSQIHKQKSYKDQYEQIQFSYGFRCAVSQLSGLDIKE